MAITPPQPRKQPKQARSRLLVDSVKQACRQVLETEGASSLTTIHLAEVVGISIGSLYQYFPNVESVVAAVYEDIVREYLKERKHLSVLNFIEHSVEDALESLIVRFIEFHKSLLELNYEFHCEYHRCFDLDASFNELYRQKDASISLLVDGLCRQGVKAKREELERTAYLVLRTMKGLIMEVMDERPEMMFDEHLPKDVLRISLAALPEQWRVDKQP